VAGTDLHHPAGAEEWVPEALTELEERVGRRGFERLFSGNPRLVLAGQELP
jgi:hypothetical protein